jgi:hypothetical protein
MFPLTDFYVIKKSMIQKYRHHKAGRVTMKKEEVYFNVQREMNEHYKLVGEVRMRMGGGSPRRRRGRKLLTTNRHASKSIVACSHQVWKTS